MNLITQIEKNYRKPALPQVQTGDTVRVHQLIKEGAKQRIQVFEGVVIRTHRMNEVTACITVRRIASNVGVEKTFLLHSPNVSQVEILRRAKVRRNFLSFLRERRGKSARLKEIPFDKAAANDVTAPAAVAEDEVIDSEKNEDALNDAMPLGDVEKAENKAAVSEDDASVAGGDTGASDEQTASAAEVQAGLDRAEPGEGEAVQS
jgi:large subunit ribosomal protein L19